MHKVITMSDSNYFGSGSLFLNTRHKVNADFVLYGPDLTQDQINILLKHNIEYVNIDPVLYKTKMQFIKFDIINKQILKDMDKVYSGFTLVDFDTFFINDWERVFEKDFSFGITIRNNMIKDKCLRAYANGGVMFSKHAGVDLLKFADDVVLAGYHKDLKEYDEIWKTLENNRPAHKTHYRNVLRWWVDQVFLSSIVLRFVREHGIKFIKGTEPKIYNFNNNNVALFDCDHYNLLESSPKITNEKDVYIRHLKSTGRKLLGVGKIKEKL